MEILIILTVLYLLLAFFSSKIQRESPKHKKIFNILILLSAVIVLAGCLTPFSFIYTFLIAYLILFANYLVSKFFNR